MGQQVEVDAATDAPPPRFSRARAFRDRVRRLPGGRLAWRIGVTLIGLAIIVVGIVLLPLPGPGWLIIFIGLGVWGTEYAWASRLLHWVRGVVSSWTNWLARRPRWLQLIVGAALLLFVLAVIVGAWLLVDLVR